MQPSLRPATAAVKQGRSSLPKSRSPDSDRGYWLSRQPVAMLLVAVALTQRLDLRIDRTSTVLLNRR